MAWGPNSNINRIYLVVFLAISALSILSIWSNPNNNLISIYAQGIASNVTTDSSHIPSAESVHTTEILKLPANIDTFVMLIVNEAHESWKEEQHKLITDKNAYFIPTNLVIYEVQS